MFVSTACWSFTLLSLLLVTSTLQPFLLPTVQASVLSGIVSQMWQPSMASNNIINRSLVNGLSGSPDGDHCVATCNNNSIAVAAMTACVDYQRFWFKLIRDPYGDEYECKAVYYWSHYCSNLVAYAFCPPNEYAAHHKGLQQDLTNLAQPCKQWTSWQPPLDSPPLITNETIRCNGILAANGVGTRCQDEAKDKIARENITDLTERVCKTWIEKKRCLTKETCKYCAWQGNEYLNFTANIWCAGKVECKKWASEEANMECPATSTTKGPVTLPVPTSTLNPETSPLPATTLNPVLTACTSVLHEKGEPERCLAEARNKYPTLNGLSYFENQCKATYYAVNCTLKAVCKYCSHTSAVIDDTRKDMESFVEECKPWSSDAPKLECPSNALLIVGIIIAVIIILVVIGVIVYFVLYFSSDKSEGSSYKVDGSHGGNKQLISSQPKSSVGAKKASRV